MVERIESTERCPHCGDIVFVVDETAFTPSVDGQAQGDWVRVSEDSELWVHAVDGRVRTRECVNPQCVSTRRVDLQLSDYSKDNFVATEMSKFTTATIPDMSQHSWESRYWLANYVLNTVLRYRPSLKDQAFTFTFLRRAVVAFSEHDLARTDTLAYVANRDGQLMRYFVALHHWEQFLGAAWHALDTLRTMSGVDLFKKGDGSTAQRLNHMYNAAKHAEGRIAAGQMPGTGPLPVWLDNDGLHSTDALLTFTETAEVLTFIATCADALHRAEPPAAT